MPSPSTPFPLFRLPYLALNEVFRSLECGDLIEMSLCSKRCKRIVKSTRNDFFGIRIFITSNYFSIRVDGKNGVETMWMSSQDHHDENSRVYMLNGEEIKIQRLLNIFEVFYPQEHRQFIITSIVNLMMDSLQIPMLSVDLHTHGFDDFLDFIPCFQNSRKISFIGITPLSEEDLDFVKNNVSSDTELQFSPF